MRSFEELAEHFESEGALTRARDAFSAGDLPEALRWLQRSATSADKRSLAAKVHYALAKHAHCERRFDQAIDHLHKAPRNASVPNFLIDERIRLLQKRSGSLVERSRASTCEKCEGNDLWRVATCSHQAEPFPVAEKLSRTALQPSIDGVFAAGAYRPGWDQRRGEAATSLMRRLKKDVSVPALKQLSWILASYLTFQTDLIAQIDAVVPIPSRGDRTAARGESIPLVICETLSDELCIPMRRTLRARREPKSHSEVQGTDRAEELADAWEAQDDPVVVRRDVLIVDDITTSGRTLRVAGDLLREAGASAVYGATLQHTEMSS